MAGSERRKYKRKPIKLDLSFRKIGHFDANIYAGFTYNVCPGGIYFETQEAEIKKGNLLQMKISIPPKAGLLEKGGKIIASGKVLRMETIDVNRNLQAGSRGVAILFTHPPKFLR